MKVDNIDDIIVEMQRAVKETKNIDCHDINSNEIGIDQIYSEIYKKSKALRKPHGKVARTSIFNKTDIAEHIKELKRKLRIIDRLCSKNCIYKNGIRIVLKKTYNFLKKWRYKSVNGSKLLSYDDRMFVQMAYKELLGRIVDIEDENNCMNELCSGKIEKFELMMNLANSEEGRKNHIRINHITYYKITRFVKKRISKV